MHGCPIPFRRSEGSAIGMEDGGFTRAIVNPSRARGNSCCALQPEEGVAARAASEEAIPESRQGEYRKGPEAADEARDGRLPAGFA